MNPQSLHTHKIHKKGSWTKEEHIRFVEALEKEGKAWAKIDAYVPTRSSSQIRSHAQKYFSRLEAQFQSLQILGKQFQKIKGRVDERQYSIYINLVKPKEISQSQSLSLETMKPTNSNNQQLSYILKEQLSENALIEESTFITSLDFPKNCQDQSFFSKMISSNQSFTSLQNLNFWSLFVDDVNRTVVASQKLPTPVFTPDGPGFTEHLYEKNLFISFQGQS